MKTYLVYNLQGEECGIVKAGSHNSAEKKAKAKYGNQIIVVYTEL